MVKEDIVNQIAGYKFIAIDHKDERIVVVMEEVENGYKGYSLYTDNEGYSLNPFFIASTFIHNEEKRFDFTNNLNEAFDYLYCWNYTE